MTALVEELNTKVAFILLPRDFSFKFSSNINFVSQVGSIVQGGGPKAVERHTSKGKLLARSVQCETKFIENIVLVFYGGKT